MLVLGVDIGGTNTKMVLMEAPNQVRRRHDFPTDGEPGAERFIAELVDQLARLLPGQEPVQAVGFAVAGLVDERSIMAQAPNLVAFEGIDLGARLRAYLPGVVVVVDNDVNAAVVAEHRLGAGRGCSHVCMLSLGTGVGGGLVLDGTLFRGASGMAAELGHTLLNPEGPPCSCGQRGHVESYLGSAAIVAHTHRRMDTAPAGSRAALTEAARSAGGLSPKTLAEIAQAGDPLAQTILSELGELLGVACANLVNAFNPERIVIGGGVSGCGELLLAPARHSLFAHAMRAPAARVKLLAAELGLDGAAVGAALLALDALDDSPEGGR